MIEASAPGRCGLVGNPTDMYGGSVISCSTRERARCTLDDDTDELIITVAGQSQTIRTMEDLEFRDDYLNVVRAVLKAMEIEPGKSAPFHLKAESDIPMQAGLAGSTAILATIVGCVLAHLRLHLHRYAVAELVRKIEYDIMGIVCGFQDQHMAVFGGINYMDFRDKSSVKPQTADAPFATVEPLEPHLGRIPLVLAHTGVKHHSGTVHRSIRDRWIAGEQDVVDAYIEIAGLARTAKKALLGCDWETLGELMNRNHAIQRDLGGSGESNEKLIAAALAGGALGAKLAGAGGGGTILALATDPEPVIQSLLAAEADAILYPEPGPGLTVEL